MRCPHCQGKGTGVVDSRLARDGAAIRRRRECRECHRRFTTYEIVEDITLVVVKNDGRREPFDRMKFSSGIERACHKRPVSFDRAASFVDSCVASLQERGEREVPSGDLGEMAMDFLRELDQVAYVRFASVYRRFQDPAEFLDELKKLLGAGT